MNAREGVARDIRDAANGVATIARQARDERDAGALTYVAVYACGYTGRGQDLERYRSLAAFGRDDGFVGRLRRHVTDTIEVSGWTVTGHDGEQVLLEQDGVRAFVEHDELTASPRVGEPATLLGPALQTGLMPGFVARRGSARVDRSDLSRLYLNLRPSAAAWALGSLAERLGAARLPYEMKVLAHPRSYLRRDACIVYLPTDTESATIRVVTQALEDMAYGTVRRPTPRLTGRVTHGVGLAHEPTDVASGVSHGQWVAGLFHQASQETTEPPAIAARVRAVIAEAGRDPRRPYLRGR